MDNGSGSSNTMGGFVYERKTNPGTVWSSTTVQFRWFARPARVLSSLGFWFRRAKPTLNVIATVVILRNNMIITHSLPCVSSGPFHPSPVTLVRSRCSTWLQSHVLCSTVTTPSLADTTLHPLRLGVILSISIITIPDNSQSWSILWSKDVWV